MREFLLRLFGALLDAFAAPARLPEEEPDIPAPPIPQPDPEKPTPPDSAFVWKPISDGDGRLAIITPFQYEFSSVRVETAKGKVEQGRYIGRGNGHRQAWRFSAKGRAYGRQVRVVCIGDGFQIVCIGDGFQKVWIVPDGAKRYESRDYAK